MTFTISTTPQNQKLKLKQNQNEKLPIQIANKQTLPYKERERALRVEKRQPQLEG